MLFRFINNFHQYRPCVWGGGLVGRFLAAYSTKISASVSGAAVGREDPNQITERRTIYNRMSDMVHYAS